MGIHFIQTTSRRKAEVLCPFACKFVKVYGGYMAFEWLTDYEIWLNQQ